MEWGNKNVVVIGDSRVENLQHTAEGWKPKNLKHYSTAGMNMERAIIKVDKVLEENVLSEQEPIDILIIMCLHCEFTKLTTWKDTGCKIMVPNNNLNILELIEKIKGKLVEWKRTHSYCQIIITIPFIPNFGRYNNSRLYKNLNPNRVKQVYNYAHSINFNRQMKILLDRFFECWSSILTPKPLALSRMEYFFNQTNPNPRTARPFQGSTTDGLHFLGSTVGKFWKLLKVHHEYLNKNPGKSYSAVNGQPATGPSLVQQMTELSVRPRRNTRGRVNRQPENRQRSNRGNLHNIRRRERDFVPSSNNQYARHQDHRRIRADNRRERSDDLRMIIQNRQNQNAYVTRNSRTMTMETRTFYRKIHRRF